MLVLMVSSHSCPFARALCMFETNTELGFGMTTVLNHIALSVDFYLARFPNTGFSFVYVQKCLFKSSFWDSRLS